MPVEADIGFSFDTDLFEDGVKRILGGMDNMKATAGRIAQGMSKGFNKVIVKIGAMFVAFKSVKRALKEIPEVGQAFGIVRDIIFKNLLFPLRKEVLPLLQKLLDWVRDNRARFVKWVEVLANIFRAVVSCIKRVLEFAKSLSTTLMGFISNIFGESITNFEELFNLLTFKFATMIEFIRILFVPLKSLIQPIIELIGDVLVGAFRTAIGFIEGFVEGFGDLGIILEDVIGLFQDIVKWLTTTNKKGDSILNVFRTIGEIIGIGIRAAIETVVSFLKGFLKGVENIATPIQGIVDSIKEFIVNLTTVTEKGNSIQTIFGDIGEIFGRIVTWVTQMTNKFLEGFVPAVENIMDPLNDIIKAFSDIFSKIFDSDESLQTWETLFVSLGKFLGETIVVVLETIVDLLAQITVVIDAVKGLIAGDFTLKDFLFGDFDVDEEGNIQIEKKGFGRALLEGAVLEPIQFFKDLFNKDKDEGEPISSLVNPIISEDNRISSANTNNNVNVNMTGLSINVNGGTVEEGMAIGEGLVDGMRSEFNRVFEAQGIG